WKKNRRITSCNDGTANYLRERPRCQKLGDLAEAIASTLRTSLCKSWQKNRPLRQNLIWRTCAEYGARCGAPPVEPRGGRDRLRASTSVSYHSSRESCHAPRIQWWPHPRRRPAEIC